MITNSLQSAFPYPPDRLDKTPHRLTDVTLTPLRITIAYLVLGLGALLVSDVLFPRYLADPLLSQVQALKGGVEVLLTAGLILVLTMHRESQLEQERHTLEKQRRELSILHRVLRHNIRNDINVILGRAELIKDQVTEERIDEHCEKVIDKVAELARYTERASIIRKTTETADQLDCHELTNLVQTVTEQHPVIEGEADVTLDLPEEVIVKANPQFPEVLEELITNALKHNDSAAPILAIDVRQASERCRMVEVSISDNGPGIPTAELDALRVGAEDPLQHPTGMGLWAVEWAVQNSGGKIDFRENEWGGTSVTLTLPKASA